MPAFLNKRGVARSRYDDKTKNLPKCDIKNFAVTHGEIKKNPSKGLFSKNAGILGRR